MQRTIRVKLKPNREQSQALMATSEQFTDCFNHVCQTGWEADEKNGVKLHHLTYRGLKDRHPFLVSDLHIQARVKATEAVRSAFALRKDPDRKVSCPKSRLCPPRYNCHTFRVNWANGEVRLSSTAGKMTLPFKIPPYFEPFSGGKVCTADLVLKKGNWWFHIVVELPAPAAHSDHCVGIDLGVNRPAVTSNCEFLGKRRWKNTENRIFRQRRELQSKGTKSAKRRLKILSGRQRRFRRDCDHVLSKHIVTSAPAGATIVLENLTDIRKRTKARKKQRRRLHGWSFKQLRTFIEYKAEGFGSRVVVIDPRKTSQTCSACGHAHRANRKTQSLFRCGSCGFTLNADLNAARNVRAKHLGTFGMTEGVRPPPTGPTVTSVTNAEVSHDSIRKPPALAGGS